MPGKKQGGGSLAKALANAPAGANVQTAAVATEAVVLSESLRITDDERLATSKSLYGDYKARISANTHCIHDRVRIAAFSKAIKAGMHGKRVLHIGCGLGLFSMLAARSAASVVAIDTSTIVQSARIVASQNKISNLTFLHGSLHQGTAVLEPEQQFDVILCEWMSSFLTNDTNMVKELAYCRTRFLAPGGVICPSQATLSVAAITDYQYKCDTVDYWDNVYGFNMAPMKELVMREPTASCIPKHLVKTRLNPVITIEAAQLNGDDLTYEAPFTVTATGKSTLHFLTWYVTAAHRDAANPAANFDMASDIGTPNPWTEVSAALPVALPVFPGDVVTGNVRVSPKVGDTEVAIRLSFANDLVTHSSETLHHFQY
jgi:protein arginine N-methyltransferase 1